MPNCFFTLLRKYDRNYVDEEIAGRIPRKPDGTENILSHIIFMKVVIPANAGIPGKNRDSGTTDGSEMVLGVVNIVLSLYC